MRNTIYWIEGPWPGKLAIIPRPRGGDWLAEEIDSWKQTGLDVIVSFLTPEEVKELDLMQEANLCQNVGIQFFSFPVEDRSVPSSQKAMLEFAGKLFPLLSAGQNIGVHCRQGIGRSALAVASLLAAAEIPGEVALQRIATARGCTVPDTEEQRQWIVDFARYVITTRAQSPHGQSVAK